MSKMKVLDAGVEGLLQAVQDSEPNTFAKAKERGIDMKLIAAGVVKEYKNNSVAVGASYVAAGLRRAISEADSSELKGTLLFGPRDSYGRKQSINIGAGNKKGETFEISTWDPKVSVDGVQQDIQYPAIATVHVVEEEFQRKDGSLASNLKLISVTDLKPISAEDVAKKLAPLAVNPSTITDEDCKQYKIVIIKGMVSSIVPADRWENKQKLAKPHNLVENNELNVSHPVFVMNLNRTQPEGFAEATSTRVTFNQRRFTVPTVLSEDLILLINKVKDKFKDDPVSQAREVSNGLRDFPVIVVGVASRINAAKDKTGAMVNYLDISGYLVVEYPDSGDDSPEESPREQDVAAPSSKKAKPEKSPVKQPKEIAEHIQAITDYCNTFGITPAELTRDKVVTDILGKGIKVGVVDDALAQARENWEE